MIDSYITRVVLAAITSKVKPDWDYFDDLMIWATDTCHPLAAQFVLAAKMADPSLTLKSFSIFDWDKFVRVSRSGWRVAGRSTWRRGRKMPAWMFFLIAAEGLCVQPTKTMSATAHLSLPDVRGGYRKLHLFRVEEEEGTRVALDIVRPSDFADIAGILRATPYGQESIITGENGYSVFTQPDQVYGPILGLDIIFDEVPIIRALNICRLLFVDPVTGDYMASRTGGELYVAQLFDGDDACSKLYRRGDRKDPFCEGRTHVQYNFRGQEYWLMALVKAEVIGIGHARDIQDIMRLYYDGPGEEDQPSGEIEIGLRGLTALEEFALDMLDKGYIMSMLDRLRVATNGGRNIPETLYLHHLTRAELAKLDEDVLEELEIFL